MAKGGKGRWLMGVQALMLLLLGLGALCFAEGDVKVGCWDDLTALAS